MCIKLENKNNFIIVYFTQNIKNKKKSNMIILLLKRLHKNQVWNEYLHGHQFSKWLQKFLILIGQCEHFGPFFIVATPKKFKSYKSFSFFSFSSFLLFIILTTFIPFFFIIQMEKSIPFILLLWLILPFGALAQGM